MGDVVSSFDLRLEQLSGYEFKVGFDKPWEGWRTDEPPPLGRDAGPNPARVLALAIGNCLAASLVFCLSKRGEKVEGVEARVHVDLGRNARGRLRVQSVQVSLRAPVARDSQALLACLDTFEDFCTVTQSVREGFEVKVAVEPVG